MLRKRISSLALAGFFVFPPAVLSQPPAPKIRALVVGNSAYRNLQPIPSSKNDAREVAAALKRLNVDVVEANDLTLEGLTRSIQSTFLERVSPGEVAIFYFSGYGLQSGAVNYLVPVDFPAERADISQAYAAARIEFFLERKKPSAKILILDACRESLALASQFPDPGLAAPRPESPGTLIAMCAPPGRSVLEPPGQSVSPFAQALVETLSVPGLTTEDVFRRVQQLVSDRTRTAQVPMRTSLIVKDFYLTGPPPPPKIEPVKPTGPVQPAAGTARDNPKDGQKYVWVPPGKFQMGCVPSDKQCEKDEIPRHPVAITRGFWIGQNEVNVTAYRRFAEAASKRMPDAPADNRDWRREEVPIVNVSWEDAQAFCEWAGGRLPSEAEWEYTARAGRDGQLYPWGDKLTRQDANYDGRGGRDDRDRWEQAAPIGRFPATPWNLYDIGGNVWEWCFDYYDPAYYSQSPPADPRGPQSGEKRVRRGGSWFSGPKQLRISQREGAETKGANNIGFRCLMEKLP